MLLKGRCTGIDRGAEDVVAQASQGGRGGAEGGCREGEGARGVAWSCSRWFGSRADDSSPRERHSCPEDARLGLSGDCELGGGVVAPIRRLSRLVLAVSGLVVRGPQPCR